MSACGINIRLRLKLELVAPGVELSAAEFPRTGEELKPNIQRPVTTRTRFGQIHVEGLEINFRPAAYFCWLLSMVIVDGQLSSGIHPFTGLPFAAEEQSAEGGGTPGSSD